MKKQLLTLACTIFMAVTFSSCSKDEVKPFATPFIHIMDNGSATGSVSENANSVGSYHIYYSTPQFFQPVTVVYKITVGNGLEEGRDYQLINEGTSITFLPGIYEMPIRIKWMANPIDISKDNTIKIELVSNDGGIILGLPGNDLLQKTFTITKVK